jgi:hypothetical protein
VTLEAQLMSRKITKVITIDDENATPVIDTIDALIGAIATGKKKAVQALAEQDPRFAAVVARRLELSDSESEERRVELRPALEQLVEAHNLGADEYRKIAEVVFFGHVGKTARRLRKQFAGIDVQAMSFAQWEQKYAEILSATSDSARLLLLVDERNEHEAATTMNGRGLLARLWTEHTERMPCVDTIILTSACAPEGEFEESKKLVVELRGATKDPKVRAKVRRAFVISKARLEKSDLDQQFQMHLNRIEAADLRSQLADLTKEVLHKAVSDSLQWLEDMPLSEFHGSVFVSSESEGAAEMDTLLRLVSIRQRGELEAQFATAGPLQEKIVQMRRFLLKHLDPDYSKASHGELRLLRQQEFERSGKLLNSVMTPLSCGDVFRLTESTAEGAKDRLAILLANPCDLALRSDGRRKAKRGWLVPLRKATKRELEAVIKTSGDGAILLYKLYTGSQDDDVGYLFTNSSVDAIDLDMLDLCWMNADGQAILDPSTLGALRDAILVAQRKRIEIVAKRAVEDRFRDIELFGTDYRTTRTEVAKTSVGGLELGTRIEYPIVRMFSLAPEFSAAALSSLSQSIARPAFGHDFGRAG